MKAFEYGRSVQHIVLTLLCCFATAVLAADGGETVDSEDGHFRLSYSSELQPIAINRIHAWTLQLEDSEGQPVSAADIEVTGGMPAHDHGLATAPEVHPAIAPGEYRLSGLRFHMLGYWELELSISAGGQSDTVIIPLEL